VKLAVFCEAQVDFQIAADLIDRVLRERGEPWVGDVMDAAPDEIRSWHGDGEGHEFFDLHRLDHHVDRLRVRVPHGHFGGQPGAAGALMARTAFSIVRVLIKGDATIDAVIVVWDMDDQPTPRRAGLMQARAEAQGWARLRIVLGCPNAMREAWVLCGFDPGGEHEQARLRELREELGFHPNIDAHRLDAKDEQAKRSAKRVLRQLTGNDRAREQRCWRETPLEALRSRGEATGLRDYLLEVEQHLLPLVARGASGSPDEHRRSNR
jgi:hypothetical protein